MKLAVYTATIAVLVAGPGLAGCKKDDNNNGARDAAVDASGPICGDGIWDRAGEECDDGNLTAGDGCSPTCRLEQLCGNGRVDAFESCDATAGDFPTCAADGHLSGEITCTAACEFDRTACVDSDSDLMAWWKLDDTVGLLVDHTGQGNGCTRQGTPEPGFPGVIGDAFFWNGTDAYADCGFGVGLDGMFELTVEAWVKPTAFVSEGMIVARTETADATRIAYVLGLSGGTTWGGANQYRFFFGTHSPDPAYMAFSANVAPTGQWHHVAGVYRSGGTLELYVDGVLSSTASGAETGPIRVLAQGRTHLAHLYDRDGLSSWQTLWQGFIDDVRIWQIARSEAQICTDAGGRWGGAGVCDLSGLDVP